MNSRLTFIKENDEHSETKRTVRFNMESGIGFRLLH